MDAETRFERRGDGCADDRDDAAIRAALREDTDLARRLVAATARDRALAFLHRSGDDADFAAGVCAELRADRDRFNAAVMVPLRRSARTRRAVPVAIAAAALLCIGVGLVAWWSSAQSDPGGNVVVAGEGSAIERGGERTDARARHALRPGDRFVAGRGPAVVALGDATGQVRPRSRLRLVEAGVHLEEGGLDCASDDAFAIHAGEVVCRLAGGEAYVECTRLGTLIKVLSGEVTVERDGAAAYRLAPGRQEMFLADGGTAVDPYVTDVALGP